MDPAITPATLDLKKDEKLTVRWQDGRVCVYTISYLRSMCPCASCRIVREGSDPHSIAPAQKKPLLTILPGDYSKAIVATHAAMVGHYAIKIDFSDGHDTGIFSFQYLREICPEEKRGGASVIGYQPAVRKDVPD